MKRQFADIATAIAQLSGRSITFIFALLIIVVWTVTGPVFHFSDTWQLVISTSTQNRDGAAIQAKLDELIRVGAARNTLIGIEMLTEDEIAEIRTASVARVRKPANGAEKQANKKAKAAGVKALS